MKTLPKTKQKRVAVCVLIEGGMSTAAACKKVGVDRSGFVRAAWMQKWEAGGGMSGGGMHAILGDGNDGNTNSRASPPGGNLEKMIVAHKSKRKQSASEVQAVVQQKIDSGEIERTGKRAKKAPSVGTILRIFARAGGKHSLTGRRQLVVKEPWNARYRYQFAEEHEDIDPTQLLHTDGKKFCLWAAEGDTGSNGYMPTQDPNAARAGMLDLLGS